MKLIAEQVKYLRDKKEVLEKTFENYRSEFELRDTVSLDGINQARGADYNVAKKHFDSIEELNNINHIFSNSEFLGERNFDFIDIGTAFYVKFDDSFDNWSQRLVLVDSGSPKVDVDFASIDSDFGKAVYGCEEGDKVTYRVKATGNVLSATVEKIDNVRENYEHFIKERISRNRTCNPMIKKLKFLKENDIEEYKKMDVVSTSQVRLVEEELEKIKGSVTCSDVAKRGYLNTTLKTPIASLPEDDRIGVGSLVSVSLIDKDGNQSDLSFEFINRAKSTELESHYVERISSFGNAIYGLRPNDTFTVKRNHKSALKGIVLSVDNGNDIKNRIK